MKILQKKKPKKKSNQDTNKATITGNTTHPGLIIAKTKEALIIKKANKK